MVPSTPRMFMAHSMSLKASLESSARSLRAMLSSKMSVTSF
jgi:hypothetical protein